MSDSLSDDSYYEDSFPEEERSFSTRIVTRRFYVFLEVFMAMLVNYLLNLGFFYLNKLIPASNYRGLLIFCTSLVSIILSVVISLLFIKAVFYKIPGKKERHIKAVFTTIPGPCNSVNPV